jgi:hypothetical protein
LSDLVVPIVDDVLETLTLGVPTFSGRAAYGLLQIFHAMLNVQLLLDPLVVLRVVRRPGNIRTLK